LRRMSVLFVSITYHDASHRVSLADRLVAH
jgi:hypothetical protein